jgi:hypothetical protein
VTVEAGELEEMGPIDYVLLEWPDDPPDGEVAPIVFDLVNRGVIRVLDFGELPANASALEEFRDASSGILGDDDLAEAAEAIDDGSLAALIVYENTWAAPFAVAVRRTGGQLVGGGRIPIQAFIAALDAVEAA